MDDICALVVIDLQKGIVGIPTVHPIDEIVSRSAELARAFREKGLPVVLVNVSAASASRTDMGARTFSFPPDWTELVPDLEQQPEDLPVTKKSWGAFLTTNLDALLRERGVTQIVLTGVATSAGVESTARSAYDLGYSVTLVTDAMTDRDAESHRNSVEKIFPRLGETCATEDVLKRLRHAD
jgi:nicotinamidase-related amidase